MRSIGDVLRGSGGVGAGFDTLRLVLASAVVFIHGSLTQPSTVDVDLEPLIPHLPVPTWALSTVAVPLFFALSGFLLAGSAERLPLAGFAANRALRIFPALMVEVVLCALLLGPLVTTLPLAEYFSSASFYRYLLNVFGWIHFELPGVFTDNPHTDYVNGSLWTVPHELGVYVMLGASVWLGVFQRPALLLLSLMILLSIALVAYVAPSLGLSQPGLQMLTNVVVTHGGVRLLPAFFTGVIFHRYRDRIPYHGGIALAGVALYLGATCLLSREAMLNPVGAILTAPIYAYAVAWAGLSSRLALRGKMWLGLPVGVLVAGDYSYGIYLYGFPLQQTLLHFFPGQWTTATFFAASLALVAAMAVLSWHLIERPMLSLRRRRAAPSTVPSISQNTAAVLIE